MSPAGPGPVDDTGTSLAAPHGELLDVVRRALTEDSPWGDLTTESLVPPGATATAVLRAREDGMLAGLDAVAATVLEAAARTGGTASTASVDVGPWRDGQRFGAGDVLATIEGSAHAVLRAERVALNLVQHLSGIATTTARFVDAVAHTRARITDTRKTTPGLRGLERHAVRCGGGHNHRRGLSDAVLVKDNHLAVLAATGTDVTAGLLAARARVPHTTVVEVEVDRLDQLDAVLAAGVDVVLLDNFTLADLRSGVARVAGRALVEASGGVRLDTVRAIAETGVHLISVGALTQASAALDLGLDIDVALGGAGGDPAAML